MDRRGVPARQARQGPGAFVRTKLKNVLSGKVVDKTFNAGLKVETANVDKRDMQYLYKDGTDFVFMDTDTYDQIHSEATVGDAPTTCWRTRTRSSHPRRHAAVRRAPASVVLEITYTEPGLQGDRSTGGTKPATLETGDEIQVPLFLETGTKVKVDTRDGSLPRPRERLSGCPQQGPQARAGRPVRGRPARRRPGDAARGPHRATRAPAAAAAVHVDLVEGVVAHGPDRRAAGHVRAGLDHRPDAGRRPRAAAHRALGDALHDDVPDAVAVDEAVELAPSRCRPTSRRSSSTGCSAGSPS